MADQQLLDLLRRGISVWNSWREEHPAIPLDLRGAHLYGAHLSGANLREADLSGAHLYGANLREADLRGANLRKADLKEAHLRGAHLRGAHLSKVDLSGFDLSNTNLGGANLWGADLRGADLRGADLSGADLSKVDLSGLDLSNTNLRGANLRGANLRGAGLSKVDLSGFDLSGFDLSNTNLSGAKLIKTNLGNTNLSGAILRGAILRGVNLSEAILIGTNLTNAILTDCSIFGVSAWNVQLEGATQLSLTITPQDEPAITIDNLKVAQFIYLLLNNREIRDVINTITSKVVLILGRFTPVERKAVLDALRDELRKKNYLPIVFDFEQPSSRNLTETVSTLAHMAHFVVADLTNAKSVPQELERIVPRLRVPVQPLLHTSEQKPYAMFESFVDYPWVLPLYRYADQKMLLRSLREHVILPAEKKALEYEK